MKANKSDDLGTASTPRGRWSRFKKSWEQSDRYIATRWPGLHVTRTHLVIAAAIPVFLTLVVIAHPIAGHVNSPPDVEAHCGIAFVLSIGFSLCWLIYRGIQYRLLPIAKKLTRMNWIWLDLVSLVVINGIPVLYISLLERQMRQAVPPETLVADATYLWGNSVQFDWDANRFFRTNRVLEVREEKSENRDGKPIYSLWPNRYKVTSPEITTLLLKYVPRNILKPSEDDHWVSEAGVMRANANMKVFNLVYYNSTLTDKGVWSVLFVFFSILVGLELWIAGLPALTGAGLLGAFGFVVLSGLIATIVGLHPSTEETTVWITLGICSSTPLLVAIVGLVRQKSTFLTKASLALSALLLPVAMIAGSIQLLDKSYLAEDDEALRFCAWSILALTALLCPFIQWCFNRLHAAPD